MLSISVIIPTCNRCDSLKKALQSVVSQQLKADEIIVIDDGSTDNTADMIRQHFPDVIYHYQPNKGVSHARNTGIRLANGKWIALLDSDDEWLLKKLKMQQQALLQNPEIKVCHTEEIWIRNGQRVNAMNKHKKSGGWIFKNCLPLCAMSPSSILIHRSVFDDVGLFDEDLPACEDYDLWLRITARYPVLFLEQALIIKHGGHEDQLSRKYWGMDRFRIHALEKIINSNTLDSENRQAAVDMLLKKSRIYLQGAIKRNKTAEIEHYQQLIQKFS